MAGVSTNVLVLGIVSLLTDMSSEMIYPILPLFLTGNRGHWPDHRAHRRGGRDHRFTGEGRCLDGTLTSSIKERDSSSPDIR